MYALRYLDNSPNSRATLVELSPAQVSLLGNQDTMRDGYWCYQYQSAQEAHRWVRENGHHETPLYVDDGRVRRASDAR